MSSPLIEQQEKMPEQPSFTPGPWHVESNKWDDIGVDDARGNFICTMHALDVATNTANARLIAAAPDMLAALRRVVRDDFESEDVLEICRAAIAKAEGK
jgi:hypothetical protein